jgi:hypothetical protein
VEEVVVEEETEEEEMVEEEMKEAMVEEVVVEEMVEGEIEEVVVVTPLGIFLSNKTATDMAARLVPQFGNSVPCRRREGRAPLVFLPLLAQPISGHAGSGNRVDCL